MRKGLFSPCYKQKHWGSEWSTELVSHRPTAAVSWGGTDNTGPHTTAAAPAARTLLSRMLCAHSILPAMIGPLHLRPGHRDPGRPRRAPGVRGRGRRCWDPPGSPRRGHFPGQWREDSFFLYVENHVACSKRQFCFFFSNLYDFSFSCLIAAARTSNTVLNKKGESKHPCFVLEIRVNVLSLSLLNTKFDYRVYEVEEVPLNSSGTEKISFCH